MGFQFDGSRVTVSGNVDFASPEKRPNVIINGMHGNTSDSNPIYTVPEGKKATILYASCVPYMRNSWEVETGETTMSVNISTGGSLCMCSSAFSGGSCAFSNTTYEPNIMNAIQLTEGTTIYWEENGVNETYMNIIIFICEEDDL